MKTITTLAAMLLLSGCSAQAVSSYPPKKKPVDEMDLYVQTAVINFLDFRDGHLTDKHYVSPVSTSPSPGAVTGTRTVTPPHYPFSGGLNSGATVSGTVIKTSAGTTPAPVKVPQKMLSPAPVMSTPGSKPAVTAPPRMLTKAPVTPKPVFSSPVPQKVWRMNPGTTLKDGLMVWASEAVCTSPAGGHWSVQWETLVNYRIDAPLQFTGDFDTAINGLFMLYQHAQRPLYAGRVKAQCLLRINDKEVK